MSPGAENAKTRQRESTNLRSSLDEVNAFLLQKVMQQFPLRLIFEPLEGTRPVLRRGSKHTRPFFKGGGDIDYICGNCDTVLAASVNRDTIKTLVFQCPSCGLYNDAHPEATSHFPKKIVSRDDVTSPTPLFLASAFKKGDFTSEMCSRKGRESGSSGRAALYALQPLPDSSDARRHVSNGSGRFRSHLVA